MSDQMAVEVTYSLASVEVQDLLYTSKEVWEQWQGRHDELVMRLIMIEIMPLIKVHQFLPKRILEA